LVFTANILKKKISSIIIKNNYFTPLSNFLQSPDFGGRLLPARARCGE